MPPHDDDNVIADLVSMARAHRFPVAIHVMDIDTLQAALDALEAHPPLPTGEADRIEPDRVGALCPRTAGTTRSPSPASASRWVTQPSFVTRRAQKYREQFSATEQEWLWPLAGLLRRGIHVTFSSDAPTVPADPQEWAAAATSRELAPAERIDL